MRDSFELKYTNCTKTNIKFIYMYKILKILKRRGQSTDCNKF